jgi:hypothetical protein
MFRPPQPRAPRACTRGRILTGCLLVVSASLASAETRERFALDRSALERPASAELRSAALPWSLQPRSSVSPVSVPTAAEARGLLPRVSARLGSLGVWGDLALSGPDLPGGSLPDDVLFDEISRSIGHQVERATRRAVRDMLFESIELERRLDALQGKGAEAGDGASTGAAQPRRLRFDLGIHSGDPHVQVRYRLPVGVFKLRVGTDRAIGLQFGPDRAGAPRFSAGFDGEHNFQIALRAAF